MNQVVFFSWTQGELESIVNFQRGEKEFVKAIACIRDSFYIFLGIKVQLNDVTKFCCEKNEVLCIDTTFNLCEHWLTDSCHGNLQLETNKGKYPIFIEPSMIHFEKEEFLFNRFFSEMFSHQSNIGSLKTIGND